MEKTRQACHFIPPEGMNLESAERTARIALFALESDQWFMHVINIGDEIVVVYTHDWAYSEATVERVFALLSDRNFVLVNRDPVCPDGYGSWCCPG